MKQVRITRMRMSYFKGIRSMEVEFGDRTEISGRNAIGKSTIVDAFFWALWGKNANGESDTKFPIKTLDEQGVEIPHVDHEVELTIMVDGATQVFRRTLVPEYDKQDNLKGNHTDYMWNDVPMKKKEYDAKVAEVISEDVFKLITSPYAFLTLPWQKQREMLVGMTDEVTDEEVVRERPDLAEVLDLLTGKTVEELKRELANKLKRVNEQMQDIPARVDEVRRNMPEAPDMEMVEQERSRINAELETVEKSQASEAEALKATEKARAELVRKQNDIKWKQTQVLNDAQREERNTIHLQNATFNEAELRYKAAQQKAMDSKTAHDMKDAGIRAMMETVKGRIDEMETNIVNLRGTWTKTNAQQFQASQNLICPLYGHACKDGDACQRYDADQQGAYDTWLANKRKSLADIRETGIKMAAALKEQQAKLVDLEQQAVANEDAYIEAQQTATTEMAKAKKDMDAHPKRPLISTIKGEDLPEWVKLQNEVDDLQRRIDEMETKASPVSNEAFQDAMVKKYQLRKELDMLAAKAAAVKTIEAAEKRIEELEELLRTLGAEKAELEFRKSMVTDFELAKCGIISDRVNAKFTLVKWKMFQRQVNGEEIPACIAMVNGVPWYYANQAARINAGIDVATVIGKTYEVCAPIFLDQAESVGRFYTPEGIQLIMLRHDPTKNDIHVLITKE